LALRGGILQRMREPVVRSVGLGATALYAALIGWLFASQPSTVAEAIGGVAATVGAYHIDEQAFADGLAFFRRDQFVESRAAFARADTATRDPRTQFYIAYSYYRQGWHRLYSDDHLFGEGLKTIDKAIALAPQGRLVVDDPDLGIRTGDELRAELLAGLTKDASDLNPLRVFGTRK
jgi:tetratricopeptide (TPR) repeat protein